jgi:hypothetical protein
LSTGKQRFKGKAKFKHYSFAAILLEQAGRPSLCKNSSAKGEAAAAGLDKADRLS